VDGRAVFKTKELLDSLNKKYPDHIELVEKLDVSKRKINVTHEQAPIKEIVMSVPTYLDWDADNPICEGEKNNYLNKPDRLLAVQQHGEFIRLMLSCGIKVIVLKPSKKRLEGVYTRDIGFVIGSSFFHANLSQPARFAEEMTVVGGIKPPSSVKIEGGNVILDKDFVFLGLGSRTNQNAAYWLQEAIGTEREVISLRLKKHILHLDCAFLPMQKQGIKEGFAIIDAKAFSNSKDFAVLFKIYKNLMQASAADVSALGMNIICTGKNRFFASAQAGGAIQKLSNLVCGLSSPLFEWG